MHPCIDLLALSFLLYLILVIPLEPIPQTRSNTIPKPSGTSSSVPSSQSSSSSSSTSASTSSSNTSSLSTTSHKTKSSTGSTATAATAASLARANAVALSATANAASSSLNQPLTDKFTKVGDKYVHLCDLRPLFISLFVAYIFPSSVYPLANLTFKTIIVSLPLPCFYSVFPF